MAYGDIVEFQPGKVTYERYSDGTRVPHLQVNVIRNGEPNGYVEIHAHHVKYAPHISIGVTSRVGPEEATPTEPE